MKSSNKVLSPKTSPRHVDAAELCQKANNETLVIMPTKYSCLYGAGILALKMQPFFTCCMDLIHFPINRIGRPFCGLKRIGF
jgi:hypothetical protein